MTRLATFVIGLTLLCGVLAQTPEHPSRVRQYETLTLDSRVSHIAVIGDSYTTGTDEGGRGPKSWPTRAWQALTQRGIRVAADVARPRGRQGQKIYAKCAFVSSSIGPKSPARLPIRAETLVVRHSVLDDEGLDTLGMG